jgi:hypothetical protein
MELVPNYAIGEPERVENRFKTSSGGTLKLNRPRD